jgi:hypothetical protein
MQLLLALVEMQEQVVLVAMAVLVDLAVHLL